MKDIPFVITAKDRARTIVKMSSSKAEEYGVYAGLALADAKAIAPQIEIFEEKVGLPDRVLDVIADWCVRFTPSVTIDAPDGLILDVSGCAHLFGGEREMLKSLVSSLRSFGYDARAAIADTIGAAWAFARYGVSKPILLAGEQRVRLGDLPPSALRIDPVVADNLRNVGIRKISDLYALPRPMLNRRFGQGLVMRLDQALGDQVEKITPKEYVEPHIEHLVCLEGVASPENIAAAIKIMLKKLCDRLKEENSGLRIAKLDCLRIDGLTETINIGTSRPSNDPNHLFKLFDEKIGLIEPGLGIELFTLTVGQIELIEFQQEEILKGQNGFSESGLPDLIDRISNRFSKDVAYRLEKRESYSPDRFIKKTSAINGGQKSNWDQQHLRPVRFLSPPELIEVTAPVPDYPPLFFRHKGRHIKIRKADGPERLECEWWIEKGKIRDYYVLEAESGEKYWVFRLGHFDPDKPTRWFLHGYFS